MKRKWDVSTKEARQKCADEILARIKEQEDAEFGYIAANDIIDIVLQQLGPDIYNLGVKDARRLIDDKLADLDIDLDLLRNDT